MDRPGFTDFRRRTNQFRGVGQGKSGDRIQFLESLIEDHSLKDQIIKIIVLGKG